MKQIFIENEGHFYHTCKNVFALVLATDLMLKNERKISHIGELTLRILLKNNTFVFLIKQ